MTYYPPCSPQGIVHSFFFSPLAHEQHTQPSGGAEIKISKGRVCCMCVCVCACVCDWGRRVLAQPRALNSHSHRIVGGCGCVVYCARVATSYIIQ